MSEFQIERSSKEPPQKFSLDSSGETDADGGGGTNFVFYDRGGDEEKKEEKKQKNRPPAPIGPPVELSLSSIANADVGRALAPGDFGQIGGLVQPPSSLSETIQKELEKAKELDVDPLNPVSNAAPGSILNVKA